MENAANAVTTEDGCRLWMTEIGHGTPLIMCHGGPGVWDRFGGLAASLARHLRVVRWDQRGCGRSERRGPYSVARSVADLEAVRHCLGLDQVAVLGHSWGAQLALRYALEHPDRLTDLIYVSGTGLGWDWIEPYQRNMTERLVRHRARIIDLRNRDRTESENRELAILQWSTEFPVPADGMRHARRMATPWFGINYECNAVIDAELKQTWHEPELVAACRNLTVPTLIIDGAADIRPRWAVDSLADALPTVTRVVLPDVSHLPWLEAPDEFCSALLNYLDRAHDLA